MSICHKRITIRSIWTVIKQGAHIAQPFTLSKLNSRFLHLEIKQYIIEVRCVVRKYYNVGKFLYKNVVLQYENLLKNSKGCEY